MLVNTCLSRVRNAVRSMNALSNYRFLTITEKGSFNVAIYFSIPLVSPFNDPLTAD